MKPIHYHVSLAFAILCVLLSIATVSFGLARKRAESSYQRTRAEFQAQQEQISTASTLETQVGPSLLRELGAAAADDPQIRALLNKHGAGGAK
jgi:hypothetical protein